MELDQIIDMVELALITSPTSFEDAANGSVKGADWCADRMPESWIIACLMKAAQEKGIAAVPEVRIRHDIQYFESGGESIRPERMPDLQRGGAKIDLLLGDESSLNGHIHLRVALEIKGPKSNWQQFQTDISRLRQLKAVVNGGDQALIFAYVTCPLLVTERERDAKQLEQYTGLNLSQFRVSSALRDSPAPDGARRSYVFMHIIRGNE
jgi:hypothetical protein